MLPIQRVNEWLEKNANVKVVEIKQSCYYSLLGASPLFITVWYEREGQKNPGE